MICTGKLFIGYVPGGGTPDTTIPYWVILWLRSSEYILLLTHALFAVDVSENNVPVADLSFPAAREFPKVFREVLSQAKKPIVTSFLAP